MRSCISSSLQKDNHHESYGQPREKEILSSHLLMIWGGVSKGKNNFPGTAFIFWVKGRALEDNFQLLVYRQSKDQWSDAMPFTMASIRSRIC